MTQHMNSSRPPLPPPANPSKPGPWRSRLIPHTNLIRRLREEGKSYAFIQQLLERDHGLKVNASSVFKFVKARSKSSPNKEYKYRLPSADQDAVKAGNAQPADIKVTAEMADHFFNSSHKEKGTQHERDYNLE